MVTSNGMLGTGWFLFLLHAVIKRAESAKKINRNFITQYGS